MKTFDALYAAHGARIYRFCYRLCGDKTDAEDLTQDVFVAAWQSLPRFAGRATEQTWLYRIALYRWNRMRTTRPPDTVMLLEDTACICGSPLIQMVLDEAIDSLPPDMRQSFLLVKVEQLSYREAAAILQIPVGTVQSRVFAAVHRLQDLLTEEDSTLIFLRRLKSMRESNKTDQFERALEAHLRTWRDVKPPLHLETRIASAVAPRHRFYLRPLLACGVCAAALGAFFMWPGSPAQPAPAFAEVERAMKSAESITFTRTIESEYSDGAIEREAGLNWIRLHPPTIALESVTVLQVKSYAKDAIG
jgi:RNA polymerase sigma-70 factor (ECF subfamily)